MKNLQKQKDALLAKRKALFASMEALMEACGEEERMFNAEEQKAYDGHGTELASVDAQLDRVEQMIRLQPASARGVDDELETEGLASRESLASQRGGSHGNPSGRGSDNGQRGSQPGSISMKPRAKAQVFTRFAMALASSRGNLVQAEALARQMTDTPEVGRILKAAVAAGTTTDTDWAAALAEYQIASAEFVELLRPELLIGRMTGFRNVPFRTRIPRHTAGASAGWVGEGAPKPMSEEAFDTIVIPNTKIAVIVALTEELVRFSNPSAESLTQQDMVDTVVQYMNEQFIDPTVTASASRPASITNGAPSQGSSGATLDDVESDLAAAMAYMAAANIPRRNRYWLINPRTEVFLMTLRTTNGPYAYRDEMVRGTLLGIPYLASNTVAIASGDTSIILVEASEILLADDGQVTLDASREASVQMSTTPSAGAQSLVSLWQNNMVGLKAERYVYWAPRRAAAVFIITGVSY